MGPVPVDGLVSDAKAWGVDPSSDGLPGLMISLGGCALSGSCGLASEPD